MEKNNCCPEAAKQIAEMEAALRHDLTERKSAELATRRPGGLSVLPQGTTRQPATISLTAVEAAMECRLSMLVGIFCDPSPQCAETRRRIHVIAEHFFSAEWDRRVPRKPFCADWLVEVTSYIDALPKTLGYDYIPVLRREAALLIPRMSEHAYDVDELLQSFFIFRCNYAVLYNRLLLAGLFLIFFRTVLEMNSYRHFRYDLAVNAIMGWGSPYEIRSKLNAIIQRGLQDEH